MPTKEPTPTELVSMREHYHASRYYLELARISTWLFVGVLALMTFLLTVGFQRPVHLFSFFFYSSLISLPLNMLLYGITGLIPHRPMAAEAGMVKQEVKSDDDKKDDDKDEDKKPAKSKADTATAWIKGLRLAQQIIFIISLLAVTGLGIASAHMFFSPPAAAPQVQGQ